MLYFLVQVNEGVKCIIPEYIISIESTNKFFNLFDLTTLGQYNDRNVKVFIRREKSEGWREVDNGLDGDLKMLEVLEFMQIIELFEAQQVGWACGSHETIGKAFVNHLANALWYIDPHLSTLSACSYSLLFLFTQLKTYKDGKTYDEYYHTSHYKKTQLSQQKLAQLAMMPEVLSLIEIIKKYSDYLLTTAASINELHYSNESAHNPGNNSTMYQVSACEFYQLKDEYSQYYQGNYLGTINYIWRIPESDLSNNRQDETSKARMLARIYKEMPRYFTRQMRKNVLNKYSYIQKISPAVLQMLHFDLTGNAAVISDAITNNGFKGTKFDAFWNEMEYYFNEQNLLAVNEKQHGTILYISLVLSIRDLCETIVDRLKAIYNNSIPSEINIPSDEWIRLQFCPSNATTTRAIYYTGRFNVKFKVQGQLLQKSSEDAHYSDNKHKIPIGEDIAISTCVRNRYSIVLQESTLAAANHDFSKLSLTPSVIFFIAIPNEITESFYDEMSPILCLYTNRGPDHRCNYGSVQIALISLFLYGDFDLLVAVYTASNHSWANPAERIMSTLNLGLQGVALKHDLMSLESKNLFGTASSLVDICKKAKESNKLESELKESITKAITEIFEYVYGTKTTEEYRPSYIQSQTKSKSILKYILIAKKIRDYIKCENCQKCHCVYSNKSLTDDEQYAYQQALESYSYSCGAPIFPDDYYLKETIFVCTQINCDSPVEILYYLSCKIGNYSICYYCGNNNDLIIPSQSLKEHFKQIYPLCKICQENGKNFYTKGLIKTNNKHFKK
ncbi:6206_t:CDS:10 [Gigaspora margarita]|uniref:6206_t:CDS:1 n=1 Tax=Gigaspora margarita TaxID=4874 RepID=A0ABN7UEJ8_GIGMA|nr:6206_t:CDS:10 [Gigaspora margarita]